MKKKREGNFDLMNNASMFIHASLYYILFINTKTSNMIENTEKPEDRVPLLHLNKVSKKELCKTYIKLRTKIYH